MDRRRLVAALAVSALALSACSGADDAEPARPPSASGLALSYSALGGRDDLDQFLQVTSSLDHPVVLEGRLEALGADGQPLPDVRVTSAYGVERGQVVIGPDTGASDVLIVSAEDRSSVVDVRIATGSRVTRATACGSTEYVTVDGVDRSGQVVGGYGFDTLRLTNVDAQPSRVQPVLLVLDVPSKGQPQQPTEVVPLGEAVDVPADDALDVELDRATLDEVQSHGLATPLVLKSYAVPGHSGDCG